MPADVEITDLSDELPVALGKRIKNGGRRTS